MAAEAEEPQEEVVDRVVEGHLVQVVGEGHPEVGEGQEVLRVAEELMTGVEIVEWAWYGVEVAEGH